MGNRAEGKTGCAEPRARPQKNSSHPNIFKMQPIYMGVTLHSAGDAEDYETLQRVGLMTVTHLEIASMAPRFESSVDNLTITMFNREQFHYVQEERSKQGSRRKGSTSKAQERGKGNRGEGRGGRRGGRPPEGAGTAAGDGNPQARNYSSYDEEYTSY